MFISTTYSTGARTNAVLENYGVKHEDIPATVDMGRLILAQMLSHKQEITAETTLSEIYTDRIMAGLEVISPRVLTDTLVVNTIEPVDKDIGLKLSDGGKFSIFSVASGSFSTTFGNLASTSATGPPVVSLDDIGNAFFSGALTASSIEIGSPDKPNGITFYDTATGEPYCMRITNGALVTTAGKCNQVLSNPLLNTSTPTPSTTPEPIPEATPELTTSDVTESEPELTTSDVIEPTPEPEISTEESPPPEEPPPDG